MTIQIYFFILIFKYILLITQDEYLLIEFIQYYFNTNNN